MTPELEALEGRDCPVRTTIALVNNGLSPDQVEELRGGVFKDFAPLAQNLKVVIVGAKQAERMAAAARNSPQWVNFTVRVHPGMPPVGPQYDDLPVASHVWGNSGGAVIDLFAAPHEEIRNPGEKLSELLRVCLTRDLAFLMGAEEYWDSDDPTNVLNTGDIYNWGDIFPGASLKGEGAAAVRAFLWKERG